LPPAEARIALSEAPRSAASEPPRAALSEPPPSSRGPMVIRVDVPSMSPMGVSVSPAAASPMTDGQLSAMARLVGPSVVPQRDRDRDTRDHEDEPQDSSGHISSVMPAAISKTPASMVPSSEGPEIHVGVLSMPHLRGERAVSEPVPAPARTLEPATPTPAPILISTSAPAAASVPTAPPAAAMEVIHSSELPSVDEASGVRHVLLRNEPGLLREVCSPVLLNRCS
jgi:hypothetical protein